MAVQELAPAALSLARKENGRDGLPRFESDCNVPEPRGQGDGRLGD